MPTQYLCKNERRRALVRQGSLNGLPQLNGIDYLEVGPDQRTLTVYFIHDLTISSTRQRIPPTLNTFTPDNIQITGGTRLQTLQVDSVSSTANQLRVRLNQPGDYGQYTLALVKSPSQTDPPEGIDPQLAAVNFRFWVEEFSEFDCQEPEPPGEPQTPPPVIDYLAKDYASFRQLMLDRLAVTMPEWRERNPADVGVMVVELLAYAADHLSYYQDAVATEAYLGTCRRRVSMRRHGRLLDYFMHDGCNARAWVVFQTLDQAEDSTGITLLGPDPLKARSGVQILSGTTLPDGSLSDEQYMLALSQGAQVFETLHDITLYPALDELRFYTWEDEQCTLSTGATQATLADPNGKASQLLTVGWVLVFQEVRGPESGEERDANPLHRHAVRLTRVQPTEDPLTQNKVVKITWDAADALPFDLTISGLDPQGVPFDQPLSVAYGNVALVDAGRSRTPEKLQENPDWQRLRPRLQEHPLTRQGHMQTADHQWRVFDPEAPANDAMTWLLRDVRPAIALWEKQLPTADRGGGPQWRPQKDLLISDRFARDFVVETEEDGRAFLRFGDGLLGKQPQAETPLYALYRTGNGLQGNVGADTLVNIWIQSENLAPENRKDLSDLRQRIKLFNPLPAQGGVDPEPLEQVRRDAPEAFREDLKRAVTEADYAAITQQYPGVQKAVATRRWTGSWQTIFITVDREDGRPVDELFKVKLLAFLEKFRLSGHDLEIENPRWVPLDIGLAIQVKPDYFRSAVKKALLDSFSNRVLANDQLGFFHPNRFTFGQPVYFSQLVALAMEVEGVQAATVTRFQRWGESPQQELAAGVIRFDRLEIAQLDNLPSLPNNGRIEFMLEGGAMTGNDEGLKSLYNRPGLSQLTYRIGDYNSFRRRLLKALPKALQPPVGIQGKAPLAKLTTRDDEDPAIALLDAWAVVIDVLTFYQERIANEGFLRTATERLSVLELARAIGYELDPGVAARAYLSFKVEDAPGSPTEVTIPERTQIMSVPAKDELPQIFETIEDFTAYLEWNGLLPRPNRPQQIYPDTRQLYLSGTSTQLQAGDFLLLVDDGPERQEFLLPLQTVSVNTDAEFTLVKWTQSLPSIIAPLRRPKLFAFRQQARLFGFNAPDWEIMPAEVKLAAIEKSGGAIQGGVFRSDSDGLLWTPTSQGLPDQDITCLATKQGPDGSPIVFAGTPEKGIFRFPENDQSWKAVNSGLINQRIQAFCVDEKDDAIYAGTPGGGVFRSKDQGENWVPINQGTIRVEGQTATTWQPINTRLPDTLVRSLLAYTTETNEGTGTISSSGTTVTGDEAAFLTELKEGDIIAIGTLDGPTARIASIASNYQLNLQERFNGFSQDSRFRANSTIRSRWIIDDISQKIENILREMLDSETTLPDFTLEDSTTFAELTEVVEMASGNTNITVLRESPNPTRENPIELNNLNLGVIFSSISVDGNSLTAPNIGLILEHLKRTGFTLTTVTASTIDVEISTQTRLVAEVVSDSEIRLEQEFGDEIPPTNETFTVKFTAVNESEQEINGSTLRLKETFILSQVFQSPDLSSPIESPTPQPAEFSLKIEPLLPASYTIAESTGTITSTGIQVVGKQTHFRHLTRTSRTLPDFIAIENIVNPTISLTVEESGFANPGPVQVTNVNSDTILSIQEPFIQDAPTGTPFFLMGPDTSPIKRHYIFVGTDEGLYRSHNYGKDWFLRGLTNRAILSLAYSEFEVGGETVNYIFAGTPFGMHRLANHGTGSAELLLGVADPTETDQIVVQSLVADGQNFFAGTTAGIYYSQDNGDNWEDSPALADSSVFSLVRYTRRGGTTYTLAATSTGVYRKTDEDSNWKLIGQDQLSAAKVRVLVFAADESIYVGNRFSNFLPTDVEAETIAVEERPEAQNTTTQKQEWPNFTIQDPRQLDLDTLYPQILPESWIVVVDDRHPQDPEQPAEICYAVRQLETVTNVDRRDFGLSGKITRLEPDRAIDPDRFGLRSAMVLSRSAELPLAPEPLTVSDRQHDIFADPLKGDTVYLRDFIHNLQPDQTLIVSGKHMQMQLNDIGGILRSRYNWKPLNTGLNDFTINDLIVIQDEAFLPPDTDELLLAATNDGLYHSADNGQTWKPFIPLRFKTVHSLLQQTSRLLAGVDLGLYALTSPERQWKRVSLPDAASVLVILSYSLSASGEDQAITAISGLTVTGESSPGIRTGLRIGDVVTIANQVRVVTDVYKEADDSQSGDFTLNAILESAVSTPTTFSIKGALLQVGTDRGFYWSTDDGQTWESSPELAGKTVFSLRHIHTTFELNDISESSETDAVPGFSIGAPGNLPDTVLQVNDVVLFGEPGQIQRRFVTGVIASEDDPNRINQFTINHEFDGDLASPLTLTVERSICLAGTDSGLYRSLNNGQTWEPVEAVNAKLVHALIHIDTPQRLITGTNQGLYASGDWGQSWEHLSGLRDRAILSLTYKNLILYAGTDQGIYRSTDQGQTWDALDAGLTASTGRAILARNNQLLVGTEQGIEALSLPVRRVEPVNWSRSNTGIVNSQVVSLASSQNGVTILAGTMAGLYRSTSGGRAWEPWDDGLEQTDGPDKLQIQVILAEPRSQQADRWFVGASEGVFVYAPIPENRETARWLPLSRDTLPYPDIRALAKQGNWLLAGVMDGGILKLNTSSLNPSLSEAALNQQRWQPTGLNNTDVQAIAVGDVGSDRLYAGTVQDGIFRSLDQGSTWKKITDTRTGRGTLVSDGNQATWSGTELEALLQVGDVINAAGQSRTILSIQSVQGQPVTFTVDTPFRPNLSPNTEFTINTGLTNREITDLKLVGDTLYAGTAGSGVFRSEDGGDRWQQVIANLEDLDIRCLLCEGPNTIWAGTATGGVFRSDNRGDLWAPVNQNLTNTDVRALLQPNQSTLLAGGIGFLRTADNLTAKFAQRYDQVQVVQPPRSVSITESGVDQAIAYQDWLITDRQGFQGYLRTSTEQIFPLLPAAEAFPLVNEAAKVKRPPPDQQRPVLTLQTPLTFSYDPATVEIAANVVRATHGETADEVLGSGDGNTSNQQFELKKPPLTYVSAANTSGSESTLEVRVDGVLWRQNDSLYSLQPQEQAYIIRIEDDGTTSVIFGDGRGGARLPSGQENITARYRSGIGADGNVPAAKLSILKTRPQGIAEVINPLAATGGANKESLVAARTNAPPTARTLRRIVSLQDFQDFAQGFAGVAKAQAQALWDGSAQVVHITLAGVEGATVPETSALYQSLVAAIGQARDPLQQVQVASYAPILFNLEARVLLDHRYQAETVEPEIVKALWAAFAFEQRNFGQTVTSAEVIAATQSVAGVSAVDLNALYLVGRSRALNSALTALTARYVPQEKMIKPAQLILLSPVGIHLTFVSVL